MRDQILARTDIDASTKAEKSKIFDPEWREAYAADDAAGMARALDRLKREASGRSDITPKPTGGKTPPPPSGFVPSGR